MVAEVAARTSVEEVQAAVIGLSDDDRAELWSWYWDMDWERWDHEFEEDVKAGRLDWLAEEAVKDAKTGKLIDLEEGFKSLDQSGAKT